MRRDKYPDRLFKKPASVILNKWEHNVWGNVIYFDSQNKDGTFQIHGFLHNQPLNVGDDIRYEVKGNSIVVGRILEIRSVNDPNDMFFAKLAGYKRVPGIEKTILKEKLP